MKVAAVGTWMGDFVTAWMVRNVILRSKIKGICLLVSRERGREKREHFLKYSGISTQTSRKAKWQNGRVFS